MGDTAKKPTQFDLHVDLSSIHGDPADELGRALRYWAGAMKQMDLDLPTEQAIYDSQYQEIGSLRLSE